MLGCSIYVLYVFHLGVLLGVQITWGSTTLPMIAYLKPALSANLYYKRMSVYGSNFFGLA